MRAISDIVKRIQWFAKPQSSGVLARNDRSPVHTDAAPFDFRGGIDLSLNKRALENPLVDILPPDELIIPLLGYGDVMLKALVQTGDTVQCGQAIAQGLLSPTSGTVTDITNWPAAHPGGFSVKSVCIARDGNGTASPSAQLSESEKQQRVDAFVDSPLSVLTESAIAGLGGAAFPTAHKIRSWIDSHSEQPRVLIVNAAECEPEIACDEALICAEPSAVLASIHTLQRALKSDRCVIAIEDSKIQAIGALQSAMQSLSGESVGDSISLMLIPTRYPAGAEPALIQLVTGTYPTSSEKPSANGVLCLNIATVHAIRQAVLGEPFVSRLISLGGSAMPHPCNARVTFGTPIEHVLRHTGNESALTSTRIRVGGPLSGFDLHNTTATVTAGINCVTAEPAIAHNSQQPCIRCGYCADVCPSALLPQQLFRYASNGEKELCQQLNLSECIECGCCDLVCPAHIPLTDTFRYAKSAALQAKRQEQKTITAKTQFERHELRQQEREFARQRAIEERKQALQNKKHSEKNIKDTLARLQSQKKAKKHND